MANLFKQQYKPKDGKVKKSAKWYANVKDADGIMRRVALCRDKTAAAIKLNEIIRKNELAEAGVFDKFEQHRSRPLIEHLADFKNGLLAKGTTVQHAQLATQLCKQSGSKQRVAQVGARTGAA